MPNFQQILQGLQLANEAIKAVAPSIQQWGSGDHLGATTNFLQIAGATAAAATGDSAIQADVTAATELAVTFAPLIFSFISMFHHKTAVPTPVTVAAPAA